MSTDPTAGKTRSTSISLAGKKALVTGAGGFLGWHLCAELVKGGVEVHATARRDLPEPIDGVRMHQLDLVDFEATRRVFREAKPEFVFHMAGHVQGSRALEHVQPALAGNLITTVNLLTLATELGCERIVLTGSQDEPDTDEISAAKSVPPSPYAASKYAASCYARMFHALYQLPVVMGRVFMAYGPGQRDLKKLIPYTILSLIDGRAPQLGSGSRPIDWIYVDDVVAALLLLIQAEGVNGRTIDVGTGELHTAREAVEMVVDLFGTTVRPEYGVAADRKFEVARAANVTATEKALSWRPDVSLREGLARTIEWYRRQQTAPQN